MINVESILDVTDQIVNPAEDTAVSQDSSETIQDLLAGMVEGELAEAIDFEEFGEPCETFEVPVVGVVPDEVREAARAGGWWGKTPKEQMSAHVGMLDLRLGKELWVKLGHNSLYMVPDVTAAIPRAHKVKVVQTAGARHQVEAEPRGKSDAWEYFLWVAQNGTRPDGSPIGGGGTFFVPTQPQGAALKENVEKLSVISCEFDDLTLADQLDRIKAWTEVTKLNFSAVLWSGSKSVHVHLKLKEPVSPEEGELLRRMFCLALFGDPAVISVHQPMRLAGGWRFDKGVTQQLISTSNETYSVEEVKAAIAIWLASFGVTTPLDLSDDGYWAACRRCCVVGTRDSYEAGQATLLGLLQMGPAEWRVQKPARITKTRAAGEGGTHTSTGGKLGQVDLSSRLPLGKMLGYNPAKEAEILVKNLGYEAFQTQTDYGDMGFTPAFANKGGEKVKCRCPFHRSATEDSRSAYVHTDKAGQWKFFCKPCTERSIDFIEFAWRLKGGEGEFELSGAEYQEHCRGVLLDLGLLDTIDTPVEMLGLKNEAAEAFRTLVTLDSLPSSKREAAFEVAIAALSEAQTSKLLMALLMASGQSAIFARVLKNAYPEVRRESEIRKLVGDLCRRIYLHRTDREYELWTIRVNTPDWANWCDRSGAVDVEQFHNVRNIMREAYLDGGGVIWRNELDGRITIQRGSTQEEIENPLGWRASFLVASRKIVSRKETFTDAIDVVAGRDVRNPSRDRALELAAKYNTPRGQEVLRSFAARFFRLPDPTSNAMVRRYIEMTMAKAITPGLMDREILVMAGCGGIGKTGVWNSLWGEENYYAEADLHGLLAGAEQSRNAEIPLIGKMSVNIDEIDGFFASKRYSKGEFYPRLKAFLTKRKSDFRRAFEKETRTYNRSYTLTATTNNLGALFSDAGQGSDRFAILEFRLKDWNPDTRGKARDRIDFKGIEEVALEVIGAAAHNVLVGDTQDWTEEFSNVAAARVDSFEREDVVKENVLSYLEAHLSTKGAVHSTSVVNWIYPGDSAPKNPKELNTLRNAIVKHLTELGFKRGERRRLYEMVGSFFEHPEIVLDSKGVPDKSDAGTASILARFAPLEGDDDDGF